ncbi:hypothetical protein KR026_004352, partial [Drosophila bipectinata]
INCALRSGVHLAINTSPYKLTFGQHMVTNGETFQLLRDLGMLEDRSVQFNKEDSLDILRSKAQNTMIAQRNRNERFYNTRTREVSFKVGQEIFRRNFQQSNFAKGFSSKLAPNYLKARVRRKLGKVYYELEDLQGRLIGNFHAKDLKP